MLVSCSGHSENTAFKTRERNNHRQPISNNTGDKIRQGASSITSAGRWLRVITKSAAVTSSSIGSAMCQI